MKKIIIVVVVLIVIILFVLLKGGGESKESTQSGQDAAALASVDDSDFQAIVQSLDGWDPASDSLALIDEALAAGSITIDQSLGYKLVALFDYTQLPARFNAGKPLSLQGDMILVEIDEAWDSLQPKTQELFEPLFLDPSEEGAFFHPDNMKERQELISELAQQ